MTVQHLSLLLASAVVRLLPGQSSSFSVAKAQHRHAQVIAGDTKWVLGLNQYSHDAGAALLSVDGKQSYIVPKERVTRAKCDGGDTAAAVEHALEAAGATPEDIVAIW